MYKSYNEIPPEQLIVLFVEIPGVAIMDYKIDSNGNGIEPRRFYQIEEHIPSKEILILPTIDNKEENCYRQICKHLLICHSALDMAMSDKNRLN